MPKELGKEVGLQMFVDSDYTGDEHACKSCTRILVYLNTAPISRHSNKNSAIEMCTFSAEFVVMTTGMKNQQ